MPSCSVKWCSNHTSTCSLKSKNGVSFHRFPKDEAICKKWVEAVRLERRDPWWASSNASRICSIHFKETDISSTPCKVNILAKTAVPVCTMVWYENNENNFTSKTSIERTVNTILKTYERKKTNMNVLKESKINMSNNWNKECTPISNTNQFKISNMTQDSVPQATKLLKSLQVSKTKKLKEVQEPNNVVNISFKTSTNVNVTVPQKKTILTELNKKEYVKSCKEQCCQSKILVKLNDNTSLILDEDFSNDSDTKFKESNKVDEEHTRICENSKKVTFKELKSNENKEPNQEVTNMTNSDMFIKTITNGNVELNANISKSYVGKMLKTYLPQRKDKISDKNIKETCKLIQKNKGRWSITLKKGLNTVKCKKMNITNVNKNPKNDFNKKLNTDMSIKDYIITDLQSNKNSQEKKQLCVFKIVKRSNLFNRPRIREQKKPTVVIEKNIDGNKESNITHLDELISSQSRIENIKDTDATVYDDIISELFETSKKRNVSDLSSNGNYQNSNEGMCTEADTILRTDNNMDSSLDKGTINMPVILDLDTNIYTELNKLMDLDLCSEVNTGFNNEINREVKTDKTATNENFSQFHEKTVTESNQQPSIMNKNMPIKYNDPLNTESYYYLNTKNNENNVRQGNEIKRYNENITNNVIILSNNELQNLEKSVVNNIVSETKKDENTVLKRNLSMQPKLDTPSELCTSTLTAIHKNLFPKYENLMSIALTKENMQVPNQDHNSEFDKNTDMEINDMVTSLHSNIITDDNKVTDSNVTSSKQFNLLEEFITNISTGSNNSETINFITNFNNDRNSTRPTLNNKMNSDINSKSKKIREKDMPDLNTVMNLELCSEGNIGFSDKINTDKTGIKAGFTQHKENAVTESNQQPLMINRNMPAEHNYYLISESNKHLLTEINGNITTQGNKNSYYNETITNNPQILSNNEMQNLDTPVVSNIVAKTRKDEFPELKKLLSKNPEVDSFAELCTNTLTDIDKNLFSKHDTISAVITEENLQGPDRSNNAEFNKNTEIDVNHMATLLQNNIIKTDATKETELNVSSFKQFNSISLEEFQPKISSESNNTENTNFTNNSKTDIYKTRRTSNNKIISDIECKEIVEKDIPELNIVIRPELSEDQVLKSNEVINIKFHHLHTSDKDLLLRKSNKDFVNVLVSDDQHIVVNEHMDVVDSILNRDVAAEFDLSLLLSDTPIPDEEIQNMDNNSNNNSLDGIDGSPNWLYLPTGEMPKIIDDILEQNSPFFENLDLFDKVNKFNMDEEGNKDNEIKNLIKEKYSNFEEFEEQIINNFCYTDKRCTKNSITQIKRQLIGEFSDYNDTSLEQTNNICNENKVSQSEKVTAEKCYNLCDEQTDKQTLEKYLHPNNEQCHKFNLNKIAETSYEHSHKEIQGSNKILSCEKLTNVDSKANQIEDLSNNYYFGPHFEQSEKSHREHEELVIHKSHDKVLSNVNIFELSKQQYDKQSNEQTLQSSVGKLVNIEESTPKSKILNQGTLESSFQEINKQISEDFNKKRIGEVNNISIEANTAGTENERELNIGQLKRAIFEQCYDPECQNDCTNQKHISNSESHKKDIQRYKKQTNSTSCQPDVEKRKRRYDLLDERQYNESSIDNLKRQINDGSFDANIKHMKSKCFLERHKLSYNEKCETKYKKIAIDHIPGKYLELRWKESEGKSNSLNQEGCKRNHKELDLDQRKILCRESINKFSQQIMAECPECGYTTDDNDLMNYKSDVDLRITKPLSLINKDMLISLRDIETENNGNNNRVALESVYAMELAYVTAIQALERKLKQKSAISEYRLKRVNNLSKINNTLIKANITLRGITHENKI